MQISLTKQYIAQTFKTLAASKEINKITIQNIVDHAQINRKSFYYHFANISALICYIFDSELTAHLKHVPSSSTDFPEVAQYITGNRSFYARIMNSRESPVWEQHVFDLYCNCCRQDFKSVCNQKHIPFSEDEMHPGIVFCANAGCQTVFQAVRHGSSFSNEERFFYMQKHRDLTMNVICGLVDVHAHHG